jgi:DNA-binding NtrC family response regulator
MAGSGTGCLFHTAHPQASRAQILERRFPQFFFATLSDEGASYLIKSVNASRDSARDVAGPFGNGSGVPKMQQETSDGYGRLNLKALLDAYERQLILTALAATAGNQRRAAASLGLLPTTLHEKMKRHGLVRRSHAQAEPEQTPAEPRAPV